MQRVLALVGAVFLAVVLSASASWAKPTTDTVTTGPWGMGVAVADPTVPANNSIPSAYAAVKLAITLRNANGGTGLVWDDGPGKVIGGCGAPACMPAVMKPGVYRFPYVAGTGGPLVEPGIGHFKLYWHDASRKLHSLRLPIQRDIRFAHLPAWAKPPLDKVTTGTWGKGVAVVDPAHVPADGVHPTNYAAIYLTITIRNANGGTGMNWDNGPNNVIAGCGAPVCLPAVMKPGVYKLPYVPSAGAQVAKAGIGHFTLRWYDANHMRHSLRLPVQSDPGLTHLPAWAKP